MWCSKVIYLKNQKTSFNKKWTSCSSLLAGKKAYILYEESYTCVFFLNSNEERKLTDQTDVWNKDASLSPQE